MVVITERSKAGQIGTKDIYKVKDYKVLPLSRNTLALTEAQVWRNCFWHLRSNRSA